MVDQHKYITFTPNKATMFPTRLKFYRLAVTAALVFLAGCFSPEITLRRNLPDSLAEGDIIHLASGKKIPAESLGSFLTLPDILYVGETHENIETHRLQLDMLKRFHTQFNQDVVIGMEMFKRPYQSVLDDWIAGKVDEKNLLKKTNWEDEWGFDFQLYRDLLHYAKEHKIPVVALNATNDLRKKISSKGIAGLSPEEKNDLPKVDLSDFYHQLYLKKIFSLHSQNKQQFQQFYEVQCFWEDYMAESISRYLASPAGHGKKMIAFLGSGHIIYDFGVPKRVFGQNYLPYVTVYPYELGRDPNDFDPVNITEIPLEPADFLAIVSSKQVNKRQVFLGIGMETTPTGMVQIKQVFKGSPAEAAGLKKGDVVSALDGETVTEFFDISYTMKQKNIGDSCLFSIIRNSESLDIPVKLFSWDYQHRGN